MKKVLMVATVPSMIGQFNMDNIQILIELGYEVHVACNFKDRSIWPQNRINEFVGQLKNLEIVYHQIEFSRSPKNVKLIRKSFCQMNLMVKEEQFEFVHCHTPMAGAISRLACYKNNIRVIYTAHGFHFYKGAPLRNWLVYYPIEKVLSQWTDVLITINQEDYQRAKEKFHAKKTVYVPGVGVDIEKICKESVDVEKKKKELGVRQDEIMLLSVGELNENKNHSAVIKALGEIKRQDEKCAGRLRYFIAGKGEQQDKLMEIANSLGVNLHLLGFRNDVPRLLKVADIFLLPSIREGLNVSLMEAMVSKLPIVCSRIRGNTDLVEEGKGGFLFEPMEENDILDKLKKITKMPQKEFCNFGEYNFQKIQKFSSKAVKKKMHSIYSGFSK